MTVFNKEQIKGSADRCLWREGDLVYKRDSRRLGLDWREKMEKILTLVRLPAFAGFIDYGYTTYYIPGQDLHGNQPFLINNESTQTILPFSRKLEVIRLFHSIIEVGMLLGYTLGDITCGNIMFDERMLYLIDYEVIVPYPLPEDYLKIWNNTLHIIFNKGY